MRNERLFVTILAGAMAAGALLWASPTRAADWNGPGLEVGARAGYAFSAGHRGAPPNGTDDNLGNWVGGQWPLWLDVGYRFDPRFYLGGFFQYGFGVVNDDQQNVCRNANVNCSASDIRLGVMGRYHLPSLGPASPWLGLGIGYEWGAYSFHQTVLGNTNTDSSWSGFEFANFQAGADFRISPRVALAPFVSVSLGEYGTTSTTTTTGNTTTTTDQDLSKTSLHEWFLIGLRFAFLP